MRKLLLATAFGMAATLGLAGGASAGTIVHDTAAEFTTINYLVGKRTNGAGNAVLNVAANRQIINNMFDDSTSTIVSLGLRTIGTEANPGNGYIEFLIKPTVHNITSGTVIELTNLGSGHRESAKLYLGSDLGGWVEIGQVFNDTLGASATFVNAAVATLTAQDGSPPGPGVDLPITTFTLTVNVNGFNSLRIVDTSPIEGNDRDGFDIAELSVTSVPEPATLALLGAGLLGLGAAARRRRTV